MHLRVHVPRQPRTAVKCGREREASSSERNLIQCGNSPPLTSIHHVPQA